MSHKTKVILIVLASLSAVAVLVPRFIPPDTTAAQRACINNLRQIDGIKDQWAIEQSNIITTPHACYSH